MFSNLNRGSSIHVLSLKDGIEYNICPIEVIKPSYPTSYTGTSLGPVVDITVTLNGVRKEFSGISATSSVSTSTDYIIADSKDTIITQVENILLNSKNIVDKDNIEKHKRNITQCEDILKKLNPSFAKEAAVDSAIGELNKRIDGMQTEFSGIKDDLKEVLGFLKGGQLKQ